MRENFNEALRLVLAYEGEFVCSPANPGGALRWGINLATYQHYFGANKTFFDLNNMNFDDVARIYAQEYWNPCVCPVLPSGLDYFVFDMAVMNGSHPTITDLQKAAGAEPDGKIGQKTLDAINRHSPGELIIELSRGRLQFLANLAHDSWHGAVWRSRIIRATREALNIGAFA